MRSFIAALRNLVLPYGATSGQRIVLDGVNGAIVVYNSAGVEIGRLDPATLFKVTGAQTSFNVSPNGNTFIRSVPDNGGYLALSNIPGFGGVTQMQPANSSVPGVTFGPSNQYVDSDETVTDSRPFMQLQSPVIKGSPDLNTSSIVLRGQTNTSVTDDSHVYMNKDLRIDGGLFTGGLVNDGRTLIDTLHLFANGNFDKTAYPNAIRITVSVTGGGGGGGGAGATGAGQWSYGDGGGGGEWAQGTFDLSLLNNLTSYTIGGGGAGGVGAAAGTNGGQTAFNAATGVLSANGGGGGSIRPATNAVGFFSQNTNNRQGGFGGAGGHIRFNGTCGGSGQGFFATAGGQRGGDGGSSAMSGATVGAANGAGNVGPNYGGGGSGASLAQSLAAVNGGAGAPGVIVITIWG